MTRPLTCGDAGRGPLSCGLGHDHELHLWDLDPIQRRQTNTQQTWVNGAWQESATKVAHYATDSDEPSWISEDVTDPSAVTRYVSGVEGDVAVTTSTTGDVELQLVDLHGDVVGTVPLVTEGDQTTLGAVTLTRTDEFGAPEPLAGAGAITGPPARYGWLGAAQRSSEALGGVVLMGVRLYSTTTGRFLSVDPVAGGSANAYDYCNADPVNCTDLGGTFSWKGLVKAVAIVGEIASNIPGPVGAAAGVSAVAYAVQGDRSKAIEMGVTAAAALVGCGPVVHAAAAGLAVVKVGAVAVHAGALIARAAPKLERAAEGGGELIRLRHYTSAKRAESILRSGVVRADRYGKVYAVEAKGRLLSPVDAVRKLGVRPGRGHAVIEFDVPRSAVRPRLNNRTRVVEWISHGDLHFTGGVRLR